MELGFRSVHPSHGAIVAAIVVAALCVATPARAYSVPFGSHLFSNLLDYVRTFARCGERHRPRERETQPLTRRARPAPPTSSQLRQCGRKLGNRGRLGTDV